MWTTRRPSDYNFIKHVRYPRIVYNLDDEQRHTSKQVTKKRLRQIQSDSDNENYHGQPPKEPSKEAEDNDSEEEVRRMKEEIAALEAQLDPTEPPTPKRVLKEQGKTASK